MKKIFLTAAAVFAIGFVSAQDKKDSEGFSKADLFVTGAFNFSSTEDKNANDKTTAFNLTPAVGYFVTENIAIGGSLGYTSRVVKTANVTTSDLSGFGVGAFGRYYFTPASKFSLFGQAALGYNSLTNNLGAKVKINEFNIGLGLGLNYFVSSNFSIEAGMAALSYGTASSDLPGDKGTDAFTIGGNFSTITFGLNYKF